jgi:hypothetical protein
MDMEIARLANTSWLQISDWQIFLLRTLRLSRDGPRAQPETTTETEPRQLPPLDWPSTLFEDVPARH